MSRHPADLAPASRHLRIAPMPFTLRNLKEDLEDVGSRFDGAPDLEFRLATEALELEESGLGYQRVPPDYRFPYGHTHKQQEEVYVVLRGGGRMELGDEIVELREGAAVGGPRGTHSRPRPGRRGRSRWPGSSVAASRLRRSHQRRYWSARRGAV